MACPACGGPGTKLGGLGNTMHYRCRNCGMDFSKTVKPRKPKAPTYNDRQNSAWETLLGPEPKPLHPSDKKRGSRDS